MGWLPRRALLPAEGGALATWTPGLRGYRPGCPAVLRVEVLHTLGWLAIGMWTWKVRREEGEGTCPADGEPQAVAGVPQASSMPSSSSEDPVTSLPPTSWGHT